MTALYRFPRSIGPRYNGAAVYHGPEILPCISDNIEQKDIIKVS